MPDANFEIGDHFRVQFVWKIPSDDFIRAIFDSEVLHQDHLSDKYIVLLREFQAGRQERSDGVAREISDVARDYWQLVAGLEGKKISLAFEADDGRPLWLRIETLTGEHNFFTRLEESPAKILKSEKWQEVLSKKGLSFSED